jgi:hypothetical protein
MPSVRSVTPTSCCSTKAPKSSRCDSTSSSSQQQQQEQSQLWTCVAATAEGQGQRQQQTDRQPDRAAVDPALAPPVLPKPNLIKAITCLQVRVKS